MTATIIPFSLAYRDRVTSESTGLEIELDPKWTAPAWTDPE